MAADIHSDCSSRRDASSAHRFIVATLAVAGAALLVVLGTKPFQRLAS